MSIQTKMTKATKKQTSNATLSAPRASTINLAVTEASRKPVEEVLAQFNSSEQGLSAAQAAERLEKYGENELSTNKPNPWKILWNQLNNPMQILLFVTAILSIFFNSDSDAIVIGIILVASVAISFANEWRSARTADSLKDCISHTAIVLRGGAAREVDVATLVPGDIVRLHVGQTVPADMRLISVNDLTCDESILTGEPKPARKAVAPLSADASQNALDLKSCALMGTSVKEGSGVGVVVATGGDAELGHIASRLGGVKEETDFQKGLRKYSTFLMRVAIVLTVVILVVNVILGRGWLQAAMFAFAIAIGITPQLMPAVVSTSLSAGSRMLAKKKVLVKQLVSIEDLGDVDVLITDKTGTLTQGHISFDQAISVDDAGNEVPETEQGTNSVLALASAASTFEVTARGKVVASNDLDVALGEEVLARMGDHTMPKFTVLASDDFDHDTQRASAVVKDLDAEHPGTWLVTKGAPEKVLQRCIGLDTDKDSAVMMLLDGLFRKGLRVIAVASRPIEWNSAQTAGVATGTADAAVAAGADTAANRRELTDNDERDLHFDGFIAFLDQPKADAKESLERLRKLGVDVKIATGDNALVAQTVCGKLGLPAAHVMTSADIEKLMDDDDALWDAVQKTSIFARVTPEEKQRIVEVLHEHGKSVAFLGDGVNDALALHAADVGISVDTATDVAKDAASVILLDKDLGVIADGISTGRRIFNNTIKFVMMGTSSNFGNMFSASGASFILPFLPMTAKQILLNNLLYDMGQLTIPTDNVDEDMVESPSHWGIGFIRKFMVIFGPISSIFDFVTFGVMLWLLHSNVSEFQTGWFIESMCTQTLIVFSIRTKATPFWKSHASMPLTLATFATIAVAIVLPYIPLTAHFLGLSPLPGEFYIALAVMMFVYMLMVEVAKVWFYKSSEQQYAQPVVANAR